MHGSIAVAVEAGTLDKSAPHKKSTKSEENTTGRRACKKTLTGTFILSICDLDVEKQYFIDNGRLSRLYRKFNLFSYLFYLAIVRGSDFVQTCTSCKPVWLPMLTCTLCNLMAWLYDAGIVCFDRGSLLQHRPHHNY